MSAEPITLPRPSLIEQLPTYADLLGKVDHLMRENEELAALADDLMRDKQHALYELHIMRGNGVIDLGRLERAIKGDQR